MLSKILAYLQTLVKADKAPIVAAALGAVTLLATRFGLHLNASDTAYIGTLLFALAGAFTHAHFASKGPQKP